MKPGRGINLVEALRERREKWSTVMGMISLGWLFLSIFLFGRQAEISVYAFPAYLITWTAFMLIGISPARKNPWFSRLFALLNGLMLFLALAGWIWVMYLSQENPDGSYTALVNLHFTAYILFFLLIYLPCFAGLMISLISFAKSR